jgi:hypothetical protein
MRAICESDLRRKGTESVETVPKFRREEEVLGRVIVRNASMKAGRGWDCSRIWEIKESKEGRRSW